MATLFADLPEALASTVEIARRCSFRPTTRAPILPRFSTGDSGETVDEAAELRRQAEDGLGRRLRLYGIAPGRTEEDYRERLAFELGVIEKMKYPGYFLIVADFIQWAKSQGIPVGPGRARVPARSLPMRSPSPTSIRSASGSCSSASSIRNASRCRTSTSTSARTAVTR